MAEGAEPAEDPQASAAGPSSPTANVGDASSPPQAAQPAGGDTLTNGGALPGSPTQNGASGNLLSGGEKQQRQQAESAASRTGGSQRGGGGDGGGDATAHDEEPGAEHEALAKNLNALGGLVSKLGRALPQADADALREAFNSVGGEADRAFSQASGMATLLNDALQQAERLAVENRELRRKQEDAVLDKQLKQAQNETEKLRVAGDAYKRELLQQKLSDTEWALSREQDRAKEAETDKAALAVQVRELKAQLKAGGSAEASPLLQLEGSDAPMSAREREELAMALMAGEGDKRTVDAQVLVRVVKGLRDTAVLEQHLQQTLQEKERLAQMVEELNDIVFSKTFKAPSAWADRERKYKMEARDWDVEVKNLHDRIEKLKAENIRYRETNRTAEFEAAAAALQLQVEAANAARVAAQQEAHELRIRMRRNDGEFTSDGKRSPYRSPFRSTVSEIEKIDSRLPTAPPAAEEATESPPPTEPLPSVSEVGATIKGLEKAGIGTQPPRAPHFQPGRTRISRGGPPLASPLSSAASGIAGSPDWGLAVLEGLEDQGVGRVDAAAPAEWAEGRPPWRSASGGVGSSRRSSDNLADEGGVARAASLGRPGSSGAPADGAAPSRRRSSGPNFAAGSVDSSASSSPRRPAWPAGGDAAAPGSCSPATASPREGAPPGSAAAAAAADAGGGCTDAAANAVWARLGGDSGAAAAPVQPARGVSADTEAGGEAGISARDRENMYRLYSHHVEAEDVGALKWQAAELASRLEMMQAQLSKAGLAAERAEEDKGNLEQELASALAAATTPPDQTALDAMQGRLAELSIKRGAREEEAAKRARDTDERLKAAQAALQTAHRERQATDKRVRKLEKQLAAAAAALGPAAVATLEAADTGSTASGEDGGTPRREGSATPGGGGSPSRAAADADADAEGGGGTSSSRRWGWGDVAGLSDEDLEAVRLREENELLMENLVRSKLEMAETQSDYVKTKRALIRAVEKQAEMSEKMDLLKAELEAADRDAAGSVSAYSGGGSMTAFTSSLRDRLSSATNAFSGGSPARDAS